MVDGPMLDGELSCLTSVQGLQATGSEHMVSSELRNS